MEPLLYIIENFRQGALLLLLLLLPLLLLLLLSMGKKYFIKDNINKELILLNIKNKITLPKGPQRLSCFVAIYSLGDLQNPNMVPYPPIGHPTITTTKCRDQCNEVIRAEHTHATAAYYHRGSPTRALR